MKRLALLPVSVVDGTRTPTVPAACTAWVCVADFPQRNRMLVKMLLPDGTAKTATTIADITFDQDGRQLDINAEALTPAQRDTTKTFLSSLGFPVGQFDGDDITDRARLLRFILRRLASWQDLTPRELLDGWDAG